MCLFKGEKNEKGELRGGEETKTQRKRKRKKKTFSPGNQHRQELVPELCVGHRLPSLRVSRLEHRVEEALSLLLLFLLF